MQNEPTPIEIDPSPTFIRNLRDLSKSYRHIRSDLQLLLDQLLQGETPGDRIQGVKSIVYKVRLKNLGNDPILANLITAIADPIPTTNERETPDQGA